LDPEADIACNCLFGSSGQSPKGPAWFESCLSDEQLSCEPQD
jgi:hypothetical protein